MSQTITTDLPDRLYQQLKKAAELSHQPTEEIVVQSLAHSLPPLLEEIPARYQPDVYPLLQVDADELQREAKRIFPADRWAEYAALLEKKKSAPLEADEEKVLDILRREADVLMLRRGYAAVLLKRGGYNLPALQELKQPTT